MKNHTIPTGLNPADKLLHVEIMATVEKVPFYGATGIRLPARARYGPPPASDWFFCWIRHTSEIEDNQWVREFLFDPYRRLPPGRYVVLRCGNPSCVSPAHVQVLRLCEWPNWKERFFQRCGQMNGNTKLTWDDVREIRLRGRIGEDPQTLAAEFKVCVRSIRNILTGRTWTHYQAPTPIEPVIDHILGVVEAHRNSKGITAVPKAKCRERQKWRAFAKIYIEREVNLEEFLDFAFEETKWIKDIIYPPASILAGEWIWEKWDMRDLKKRRIANRHAGHSYAAPSGNLQKRLVDAGFEYADDLNDDELEFIESEARTRVRVPHLANSGTTEWDDAIEWLTDWMKKSQAPKKTRS